MKMEQAECSETSAYKIQTQGNYPEGSIQHSEHGERLKSKTQKYFLHDDMDGVKTASRRRRLEVSKANRPHRRS